MSPSDCRGHRAELVAAGKYLRRDKIQGSTGSLILRQKHMPEPRWEAET